ncbi:Gfo/Idh/MocA family protein [Prosthecomicrobium sp. N25]|uniref:Gfo/Idh/MocA family protein n=1 Tax=Prosthecomicrobium sp. N25 TaxID=3129254 RepID=UPI0030788FCF
MRGALIGCGFFARNHLAAWRGLGVDMVLCDRVRERAEALGAEFGAAALWTDAAAMLAGERLDFVDIATTVESHRALVEQAAARGLPTICQKPFALDLDEGRAMVAAAARAGVPLLVHENFRWQTPMLAVADALTAGAVGRPHFGRISFRHGFDIYANQPYLATEPRLALVDVGVHVLDLARFFLGDVTRLYARTQRLNPKVAGEDAATLVLDHAGGAVSTVEISFFSRLDPDPFPQTLVRIEGDRGTVELGQDYRLSVTSAGRTAVRSVEPAVPPWGARPWHAIQDSVVNIERHFLDCLRTGAEPRPSGADNLKTLELVFAAYDSAARGEAVAFPREAGR